MRKEISSKWFKKKIGRLIKITIAVVLILQACSRVEEQFESVLKLPENFHGKEIMITGTFHYNFEDVAIYLSSKSGKEEAIWTNFSNTSEQLDSIEGLNGKIVRIKGTFNKNDRGHLGQYAGSLENPEIIEVQE